MLPAKDELTHYIGCVELSKHERAVLEEAAAAMSPAQATAWMALIQAAEKIGGEYDYSRTDENADDAQVN